MLFKDNNKAITKLGFGCWGIGTEVYGKVTKEQAITALRVAKDNNITFFDTAPTYGCAEELLGETFDNDIDIFIATKVEINTPETIKQSVINSLKRLKRDKIDLLQLHNPKTNDISQIEQTIEVLYRLQEKGYIDKFGVSLASPDHISIFAHFFSILQINFSLIDQRLLDNLGYLYDVCFLARTPFGSGTLIDQIDFNSLSNTDRRKDISVEKYDKLQLAYSQFADILGPSKESGCLGFCMSFPKVAIVIAGMISQEQVLQNARAIVAKDIPFNYDILAKAHQIYLENLRKG